MHPFYMIGDIDEIMFRRLHKFLCAKKTNEPVSIILSSGGGSAYDAIAIHDRLLLHLGPVNIHCYGTAFSAALLVLAAGTHRTMTPNSWVMAHEDLTDVTKHDKVTEAEKRLAHGRRLEQQWCKLLADATKTSVEEWEELHKNETYLSATECLELGLIDEILGD